MNEETELREIRLMLTSWVTYIKVNNAETFFDINKYGEGLSLKLLNSIYDYHLIDLNDEQPNHPYIDLGDKTSKIAFQVTSNLTQAKINHTEAGVKSKGFDKIYQNGIHYFVIDTTSDNLKKLKVTLDSTILTLSDISKEIRKIYNADKSRFDEIKQILIGEFGFILENQKKLKVESIEQQIGELRDQIHTFSISHPNMKELEGLTAIDVISTRISPSGDYNLARYFLPKINPILKKMLDLIDEINQINIKAQEIKGEILMEYLDLQKPLNRIKDMFIKTPGVYNRYPRKDNYIEYVDTLEELVKNQGI